MKVSFADKGSNEMSQLVITNYINEISELTEHRSYLTKKLLMSKAYH